MSEDNKKEDQNTSDRIVLTEDLPAGGVNHDDFEYPVDTLYQSPDTEEEELEEESEDSEGTEES